MLVEDIKAANVELMICAPHFSPSGIERLSLNIVPLCRNRPHVRLIIQSRGHEQLELGVGLTDG